MDQRCIPPEDLGRVLRLPPESPERRHLVACPRCQALCLTYREFMDDRSVPPGSDPETAGVHLRAAFQAAMGTTAGATGETPSPTAAPPAGAPPALLDRLRYLAALFIRPRLFAPGVAAILVAIALYVGFDPAGWRARPDSLRGAELAGRIGENPITLLAVTPRGSDGVELAWRAVSGADRYEVAIMGTELADLVRLTVDRDTCCAILWTDLPPAPDPSVLLGWQVVAYEGHRLLARSPIGTLRRP